MSMATIFLDAEFHSQQALRLGVGQKACLEHASGPLRGELKVIARQAFRFGDKHKAFCEDESGRRAHHSCRAGC